MHSKSTKERLADIETRLAEMGATPEYCRSFFHSSSGTCDEQRAGACTKHSALGATRLPAGKMCADELRTYLSDLKTRISQVENSITGLRQQWQDVSQAVAAADPPPDSSSAIAKVKSVALDQLEMQVKSKKTNERA
jgi:hypothetical protein